jgi:hypothetical protein
VDDLLGGLPQVQRGPDPGAGLRQEGEAVACPLGLDLRPLAVGDVDEGGDHAEAPPGTVEEGRVGAGPGPFVVRVGRGAAGAADVDHRLAPFQDLPHHGLQRGGVDAGGDLGEAFAQVVAGGDAVHSGECLVDPQEAQVGAEQGETDG